MILMLIATALEGIGFESFGTCEPRTRNPFLIAMYEMNADNLFVRSQFLHGPIGLTAAKRSAAYQ